MVGWSDVRKQRRLATLVQTWGTCLGDPPLLSTHHAARTHRYYGERKPLVLALTTDKLAATAQTDTNGNVLGGLLRGGTPNEAENGRAAAAGVEGEDGPRGPSDVEMQQGPVLSAWTKRQQRLRALADSLDTGLEQKADEKVGRTRPKMTL